MTSQDPNGMSSRENSSNQPWNYTALLSCNGNLDLHFRPKPGPEPCFVSEAAQRVKGESEKEDKERTRIDEDLAGLDPITVEKSYPGFEKKDKERTRMDEDLAGLDPITVEKSYPVKRIPTLLSLNPINLLDKTSE